MGSDDPKEILEIRTVLQCVCVYIYIGKLIKLTPLNWKMGQYTILKILYEKHVGHHTNIKSKRILFFRTHILWLCIFVFFDNFRKPKTKPVFAFFIFIISTYFPKFQLNQKKKTSVALTLVFLKIKIPKKVFLLHHSSQIKKN